MEERKTYFLYNPQKIIEDAQKEPGVQPVRLFAVLFPLWRVILGGTFREQKPYALLEEYLERGIFEGELNTTEDLAGFFGIDPRLVNKVLDFLLTIEHVEYNQGAWSLRPLGQESLSEGQKYIPKKNRQEFLFEAFHAQPLTRDHYEKIQIATEQEAEDLVNAYERSHRGYTCERLYSFHEWSGDAVAALAHRPDRAQYNLRKEISGVHQVGQPEPVYLPLYLIEALTKQGQRVYLAYSRIRGRRDHFFEHIVNQYPDIREALAIVAEKERGRQSTDLWKAWLTKQGLTNVVPLRMPSGIWQLNLPANLLRTRYPPLALEKIGTYYLEEGYFLYIWCNDVEIRRDAAIDRVLRLVEQHKKSITQREVEKNLQLLAEQLGTRQLDLSDLKKRATETGRTSLVGIIDAL